MQVTQPASPLASSPSNLTLDTTFNLSAALLSNSHGATSVANESHGPGSVPVNGLNSSPVAAATLLRVDTNDPNWQATKSCVRERNAAMYNNDLMADIKFVVGSEGIGDNDCWT